MSGGWMLPGSNGPTIPVFVCGACNKLETDEKGAHFKNGWVCMSCGYYRLPPKPEPREVNYKPEVFQKLNELPKTPDDDENDDKPRF